MIKSSVEELSALERKLNIEVPVEKISESFARVFKNIQKDAEIKGYRKGKAPLTVIRKMYKDRVHQDVLQDLVHQSFYQSVEEHKLEPMSQPAFDLEQLNEDKSFQFTAKFEIRPEIVLKKYEGLPVEKEKMDISDKQIDDVIENLRNSKAENVDVFDDRPITTGDIAMVDFEGFVDGAPLPNGKAEGHELEIGSNSFIEGFEEGILGMKSGDERTIDLKFPDEYHAKDIAGKPVQFKVRLANIKKKSIPELNDEFVKTLGGDAETVDALKVAVKEDIEKREAQRIEEEMKNRLLKELVRNNPVDVPPSMLADQKKTLISDFQQRMSQQGMTETDFAEYASKWEADFEASAKQMIQSSFLIDAISRKHELGVTDKGLQEKMEEIAGQSGLEMERIQEFYSNQDQKGRLSFQVTEQNVVSFLLGSANVHEVPKEKLVDADEDASAV